MNWGENAWQVIYFQFSSKALKNYTYKLENIISIDLKTTNFVLFLLIWKKMHYRL